MCAISDRSDAQVLIVDDYPDAGDSLALLLRVWGYSVAVVRTGQDALLACRQFQPRLALVELRLKGMDGFTLAKRLLAELPHAPMLVALTGQADAQSRRRAAETGFALYMVKPGDPEQLRAVLERLTAAA